MHYENRSFHVQQMELDCNLGPYLPQDKEKPALLISSKTVEGVLKTDSES